MISALTFRKEIHIFLDSIRTSLQEFPIELSTLLLGVFILCFLSYLVVYGTLSSNLSDPEKNNSLHQKVNAQEKHSKKKQKSRVASGEVKRVKKNRRQREKEETSLKDQRLDFSNFVTPDERNKKDSLQSKGPIAVDKASTFFDAWHSTISQQEVHNTLRAVFLLNHDFADVKLVISEMIHEKFEEIGIDGDFGVRWISESAKDAWKSMPDMLERLMLYEDEVKFLWNTQLEIESSFSGNSFQQQQHTHSHSSNHSHSHLKKTQ